MLPVDMSQRVKRLLPELGARLEEACYTVRIFDPAKSREKHVIRILGIEEIAAATHRDILLDVRDEKPSFIPAANGLPARLRFGMADCEMGYALISELLRPSVMPAVGDPASATLMRLAARVAASDATVLIQGDTGTGKEGMARFIHASSPRHDRDFIAVNCAALPETMMEAMLFGHRKGSFTGAATSSEGLFQAANGGTLFLDEVAELPLALQAKLLRALQEGEVLPVGATHPVAVDVRVVAACNRNLAAEADAGRFRADLYWRLNVMPLTLSPLVERPRDIPAITAAFLLRHQLPMGMQARFALPTAEAMAHLAAHSWPGNARELGNVLHRALVLREGDAIEAADLSVAPAPSMVRPLIARPVADAVLHYVPEPVSQAAPIALRDVARHSRVDAIRAALRDTDGHRARAAQLLGISERTLRYRLAEMRELAVAV
ncbi:MAG TPA: sigma-54 dependent transcriptional regulator [Sphingobium sp.]